MKNLKSLKGIESYEKMSITNDYMKAEHVLNKSWATEAKKLKIEEPKDSEVIWRVRGIQFLNSISGQKQNYIRSPIRIS